MIRLMTFCPLFPCVILLDALFSQLLLLHTKSVKIKSYKVIVVAIVSKEEDHSLNGIHFAISRCRRHYFSLETLFDRLLLLFKAVKTNIQVTSEVGL